MRVAVPVCASPIVYMFAWHHVYTLHTVCVCVCVCQRDSAPACTFVSSLCFLKKEEKKNNKFCDCVFSLHFMPKHT